MGADVAPIDLIRIIKETYPDHRTSTAHQVRSTSKIQKEEEKKILCTQWSFFMLLFWDTSNWYWRGCFKLISFPFDRHERTLWIIFCGAIHVKELSDHPHENISLNSQFYSIFFQVGGPIGIIFYFIVYYTCILHEPPYPVRGMMVTVDSFFGHSKWPLRISKTRKRELHSIGLLFFH